MITGEHVEGEGSAGRVEPAGARNGGEEAGPDRAAPDQGAPDQGAPDQGAPDPSGIWSDLVRVHTVACRRIEADLFRRHELTLASYDVVRALALERTGRLRMAELAESVVLSRSGVSRVVDGLERQELVQRQVCDADLRGLYAVLTVEGHRRYAAAAVTHGAAVDAHLLGCLAPHEQRSFGEVLSSLARSLGPGVSGPLGGRSAGRRTAPSDVLPGSDALPAPDREIPQ